MTNNSHFKLIHLPATDTINDIQVDLLKRPPRKGSQKKKRGVLLQAHAVGNFVAFVTTQSNDKGPCETSACWKSLATANPDSCQLLFRLQLLFGRFKRYCTRGERRVDTSSPFPPIELLHATQRKHKKGKTWP